MNNSYPDQETRHHTADAIDGFTMKNRLRKTMRPALLATLAAMTAGTALADAPPVEFGINLGGGDATSLGVPGVYGTAYAYPTAPSFDYYQGKGLNVVRLPVKWKRIQNTLNGPLDEVDMVDLDNVMQMAANRGMKVIIDLHDYGHWGSYDIGSTQVPFSYFAHLWGLIANRYKNNEAVLGYDLMNEPELDSTTWFTAAQAAINAIRQVDSQKWIYVEGRRYSSSWYWPDSSDNLKNLVDPSNRIVFSAHSYWDGGVGTYTSSYATLDRYPEVGIRHVEKFVEWCNLNGVNGHVGEFGVPWTDTAYVNEWNVVLNNFLATIKANNIGGTYWGCGAWNQGYNITLEPAANGTERPAMSVMQNYGTPVGGYPITVDNTNNVTVAPLSGGWTTTNAAAAYGGKMMHDGGPTAGSNKSVTFTPRIAVAGNYTVSINWTTASNRSTYVPLTIVHAGGTDTSKSLDQKNDNPVWKEIGTYFFNAGTSGSVKISNTGANGHVIADAVKFTPATGLPTSWANGDIGAVNLAGSSTHSGGVYTVSGSGATIGGTADSFQFAHRTFTGNCRITARVYQQSNSNGYARAGVMIRDGLAANARSFAAVVTPSNGGYLLYRTNTAGSTTSGSGGLIGAPYWLRVTRIGDTFTAEKSIDGSTWAPISSSKIITMGATVQVGLAVCSYNNNVLGSATFDNVSPVVP
jgi:endoglucanase